MSTREEQTRRVIKLLRRWVGEDELVMVREHSVTVSFACEPGFVYVTYETEDWLGTISRHTHAVQGERALDVVRAMCGNFDDVDAEERFTPPTISIFPTSRGTES